MPIFEYLCVSCGHVFETIQYGNGEKVSCPKCGSPELSKLLSATSSLSGSKPDGKIPGMGDTGCCGANPTSRGCVPGSCCGKA
ncbi:MAG: zinc ribbon domain-containing protein [Syntrophobacter sp.]